MMFTLYMLMVGASALTIQHEAHSVAPENCRFRGKHYKREFRLEGEPVVLRCPQVPYWLWASASLHVDLTWHKNDSARMVPGEETRLWAQDGALWVLPVLKGDSGTYICTTRNASRCDEMSIELRVFENTESSLPLISYPQILTLSTSGTLVCPDLSEFTRNKTDVKIQWYKDSVLLDQDNKKFVSVEGTTRLLVHDVSVEDAGYYSCAMTFTHKGQQYNITRIVELRVKQRKEETIPVIISPVETISASMGSRLTIPCKVFLGAGTPLTTMLWWTANNTHIESAYQGGRVTEGLRQEYSENNKNYIEVPLIFDPVIREDLNTDFKCVVLNTLSFQTLRTTVKEAPSTFSWGMVLAPLLLVVLVLGGIWIHRRCKHRSGKAYGLTTLKTCHQDFLSRVK
ncbi:interleukin-1 receptor type 2 isoform X2 [Nycticebus coucang]|nr:interleukin-1 receptor type 2 isoform X2 [Nycticebus coucang]XP_053445817.1 interleukin-1 receptor type 2 isoform X2 [Nycticebus coucang]XP_053445818.1 interleukin-1 receptor type 2 isoform X2 [Nycticebus coucang]